MSNSEQTLFKKANIFFLQKEFIQAIEFYQKAIVSADEILKKNIQFNLNLANKKAAQNLNKVETLISKNKKFDNHPKIVIVKGQQEKTNNITVLLVAHALGKEIFGAELSFIDMVNGLSNLGYNIVVALPNSKNKEFINLILKNTLSVIVFNYSQWRGNDISDEVVAAFASIIVNNNIDVVHVNTIMLREPLLASKMLNIPSILHVRELISHDVHLCDVIGESPDLIIEKIKNNSDYMIANSEATAKCFLNKDNLFVVKNTVDTAAFKEIPLPIVDSFIRVGLISSNLPKKGIFDFLQIAKILEKKAPNIKWNLIGTLNEHTIKIQNEITNGQLPKSIHTLGYIDSPALAIAETDIVLNLSHFMESFGRTILEAMAAARPVIVYDWGALTELVEDGETGYVVPYKDINAVAERIFTLYKDRSLLKDMGLKAQIRAKNLYGFSAYCAAMKKVYNSITSTSIPRTSSPLVLKARNLRKKIQRSDLKVAYFCWHFPVPSETFVLNELRILKQQGVDVIVFCKQAPYPDFKIDFEVSWERVQNSDHLAQRLIETNRTIIHGHFVYPTVTDMVWPAAEKACIPFTCIAHAQDIFRYKNASVNQIDVFSKSPWCKQIFTLSRFHRKFLIDQGVSSNKITINSNCIDPDLFVNGKIEDRGLRLKRRVCAVSRFAEKKGLELLIKAGKLLVDSGVIINIYGYGPLEDEYRRIIKDEGISNVIIHGPIEDRDSLLTVFREHDLFACPSIRAVDGDMDGIPTTLMESMAAGLPVLTTPIAGIPDLVQDGITGFMCTDISPEGIATKIKSFYSLPNSAIQSVIEDAEILLRRNHHGVELVDTLIRFWANEYIDLMIVSYNNKPQTTEVIRRLYEYTNLPFHIVVCDNGSNPDALSRLIKSYNENDNFTLILNNKNSMVGPGTNLCIQQGNADYMIYVCGKEGMTTNYGWEKSFINYMNANLDVGIAGTLCSSPSYLYGRDYSKGIPLFNKFRNTNYAAENHNRVFKHVQGGFFVIRRKTYDQIGGFSDEVPHDYTDVEYSYYAESCGWNLGEVPKVMSLFNKTKPGLEGRVDESHSALHPPKLEDLPWLDKLARQEVRHCNICGFQDVSFRGGDLIAICGSCGSTRRARSIYRVLAESILLYRRLPALGVGIPLELNDFWSFQFQGVILSKDDFIQKLINKGRLENRTGGMKLIFVNDAYDLIEMSELITNEIHRLLSDDGDLYVCGESQLEHIEPSLLLKGFIRERKIRFSSLVSQYDWVSIGHYKKKVENLT